MKLIYLVLVSSFLVATASADSPGLGANGPAQAAADALRQFANADGAFIGAALVKTSFQKDKLETILEFPTDGIVVLNLTGTQIRQAFEKTLSYYPQSNTSFLQISGFDVTFSKTAAVNHRIVSVTADGVKLDEARTYKVAMPSLLGHGGLGYFKIWQEKDIARKITDATLESVLKGKAVVETPPRWIAQ